MSTPIEKLLHKARHGDKQSLEALLSHIRVRFLAIAKRRIGWQDAEDVVQDACLTIAEKYRQAAPDDHFEGWAFTVLRNKIGNYLQHQKTVSRVKLDAREISAFSGQHDVANRVMLRAQLLQCFRKLLRQNTLYARALNLLYQGYSSTEICDRLNIASGYLYVALQRGRKSLGDCIKRSESSHDS